MASRILTECYKDTRYEDDDKYFQQKSNYFGVLLMLNNLDGLKLLKSLQSIEFGQCFNQDVSNVKWPSKLQSIAFGYEFNQDISNVKWPSTLQSIKFEVNSDNSI